MYKLSGRGGGRGGSGAAKRPLPPHGRGRGGASSIGGMAGPPRGRAGAGAATQPAGRDEAFRLESSGPPAFAAIIRLTPDLVDEIRRAEEAGGGARIKFNPNMYNSSENVSCPSPSVFQLFYKFLLFNLTNLYTFFYQYTIYPGELFSFYWHFYLIGFCNMHSRQSNLSMVLARRTIIC
jgi:hypothetical protein